MYIITLLNPLPVLVALKILQEVFSFMINICPLGGCLENSDQKLKQFRVYRGLLQVVFTARRYNVQCANVFGSATICIAKLSRNTHRANRPAWFE